MLERTPLMKVIKTISKFPTDQSAIPIAVGKDTAYEGD